MNPSDEQRLTDEVIYLHSLWHQGPPIPLQNTLAVPIPAHINIASASEPYTPQPFGGSHFHGSPLLLHRHLQQPTISSISIHAFESSRTRSLPPTSHTAFKNKNKKKKKKNKRRDPPKSPGPEWPCPVLIDPPAATSWPTPKQSRSEAPILSPQEKERLAGLQVQIKSCQAFRKFLLDNGYDDEDNDDDEDDDEDDEDDWEEFEGFFVRIFKEDDGLKNYYQRCFETGEFCCLVCGAIGKKNSGKKFKDCVALVQHSMSISRTVKKQAHRAFGQAVCKVMGWDIDRLPIIIMKGEPLGCSVETKPAEAEKENRGTSTQ